MNTLSPNERLYDLSLAGLLPDFPVDFQGLQPIFYYPLYFQRRNRQVAVINPPELIKQNQTTISKRTEFLSPPAFITSTHLHSNIPSVAESSLSLNLPGV